MIISTGNLWALAALVGVNTLLAFALGVCARLGPRDPERPSTPPPPPPLPRAGKFTLIADPPPPPGPPDWLWDTQPLILRSELAATAADLDRYARTYQGIQP